MRRLNARQLRTSEPDEEFLKKIPKNPLYLILDNVLDTYNVGAIFRLADWIAARKIFLCGETQTPPNPKIKKASINTWKYVSWEYLSSPLTAVSFLRKKVPQIKIIAVEQNQKSLPLSQFVPSFPLAIIVGNETFGVGKEVLKVVDEIVEIPMYGVNRSLNVMVCLGMVLYKISESLEKKGKKRKNPEVSIEFHL